MRQNASIAVLYMLGKWPCRLGFGYASRKKQNKNQANADHPANIDKRIQAGWGRFLICFLTFSQGT